MAIPFLSGLEIATGTHNEITFTGTGGAKILAPVEMYLDASNDIYLMSHSSVNLTLGNNTASFAGIINAPDGSATTPAYNFTSHDGNGIYLEDYDASNNKEQVSIATDGSRRMRVNEAGIWTENNFYANSQFRKLVDSDWMGTHGVSGRGFQFKNTHTDTNGVIALDLSATGNATFAGSVNLTGVDVSGVTSPTLYIGQLTNAYQAGIQSSTHLTSKTINNAGNFYWYRNNSLLMYYTDALYVNKIVDKDNTSFFIDPGSAGSVVHTGFKINAPDEGGAPAMTAILNMHGYEGRGVGIKMKDNVNSASGSTDREWFVGTGYNTSGFNIGYASDGSQSSYSAQSKLSITTGGDTTAYGKLTARKSSSHTAQGTFSATHAHLDLYNSLEANTDQKGSIINFSDHYYDGTNYIKTTRAGIKGGTDSVGNNGAGYLEFYTNHTSANTPRLVLRLDKDKNATFSGNLYVPEYIYHDGNTTTYARFQTNRLTLHSGGGAVVDLHSNGQLYFTGASTFYNDVTAVGDTRLIKVQNSNGNSAIQLLSDSSGDGQLRVNDSGGTTKIFFYGEANNPSYINNGGNLGVGVSDPDAKVEIVGNGRTNSTTSLRVRSDDDQQLFYVRDDGVVSVTHDYFYVDNNAGMYSNGIIRARAGVSDDGGPLGLGGNGSVGNLTLTSNTSAAFAGTVSSGNITVTGGGGGNGQVDVIRTSGAAIRLQSQSSLARVGTSSSHALQFTVGDTGRWNIQTDGHFRPVVDSTYDIGTNALRVRNVYADTLYGDGSNLTGITTSAPSNMVTTDTSQTISGAKTFSSNVRIPVAWDSGTLENNAIYAKNSTDGFGFGNGTGISTWWAWSTENGLMRMIDSANSGAFITLRTANTDRVSITSEGLEVKNGGDVRLYSAGSQVRVGSFTSGSSNNGEYDDDDIVVGDGSISIYPHRRGDYGLNATSATSTTFRSKLNIWSDNEDHITFGGASTHMVSAWEDWKMWINNDSGNNGHLKLYHTSSKTEFARLSGDGANSFVLGTFKATGDLRAPIFYDSIDTSYFVHADNNSVLKSMYVGTTGADQTYNIRLDAANKSSIGFHDSGSTIGAITFSGSEGFRLGANQGSYGPHSVSAMDRFFVAKEVTDVDGQSIKGYRLNKATSSSWTEGGTGAQTGWYGGNFGGSEITTKWVDGPHGERTLAAETTGDTNNDYDGGYVKAINNLDINKSHLSIVYIKRISSEGTGNVYHGTGAGTNQITNLSNTSNTNPYFHYPSLGSFPQDVWCVSIGVIQANNDDNTTAKTGSNDLQGIYRCDTGQKIMNSSNYWKMGSAGSTLSNGIRFFHYYSTNANAKLQWAKPGFYEINGDEPSLAEILTGGNRGLHTNGGDVTANKFYDWANTAYYLDPADTGTSLNVAGQVAGKSFKAEGSSTDQYFYEGVRTGVGTTLRIYDNSSDIYYDSWDSMTFRANQNGGSGGAISFTGGNVNIQRDLTVGTGSTYNGALTIKSLDSSSSTRQAKLKFNIAGTDVTGFTLHNNTTGIATNTLIYDVSGTAKVHIFGDGHVSTVDNMTAKMFRDVDNTAYYVDPAGASSLNSATFAGTITASGGINGLTLANGGISGSNYNISGVNQLSIADPGEGIVFGGGSSGNIVLAVTDDSSDNILAVTGGVSEFSVSGNVKHEGLTMTTGTDVDQVKEFSMTFQLAANTWTDTNIDGTDLTTGTYAMQVLVDDYGVAGEHYSEYYSATISWFGTATNSTTVDEIFVHRAGHAPNNGDVQFRTQRALGTDSHDLMLQVKHNKAYNAALDGSGSKRMIFKFRRLI